MAQRFITIAVPFKERHLHEVDRALSSLSVAEKGNRPEKAIERALDDIGVIHYMSMVAIGPVCPSEDPALRDQTDDTPAHLLIEIASDRGIDETIALLGRALGAELERVFVAGEIDRDGRSLEDYLRKHFLRIGAEWTAPALGQVHSGSPGMTVRRICRERELAKNIGVVIEEERKSVAWRDLPPRARLESVRRKVWDWGDTKWAFVAEPTPVLKGDPANPWDDSYSLTNPQALKAAAEIVHKLLWPLYVPLALAWFLLSLPVWRDTSGIDAIMWPVWVAMGLALALLVFVLFVFVRLRSLEKRDMVEDKVPPADQVAALMRQENHKPGAQNHMATISRLKKGWIRKLTLRLAFIVVGTGRLVGAPGFLGKNGVIHFARWMRLPGTSQLIFWSNFDNTWESYVADFIADAPTGVTAIWSNCVGFPRSRWLFGAGAEDHNLLVPWARRQQRPTPFWYAAYPDLTTARIRNNAAIRQGLASAATDADARDWLSLFGSAPRPANNLEMPEIPTLVFGGLSSHPYAACLVVALGNDKHAARKWLADVTREATYGEVLPANGIAVAIGLAATALKKLDVSDAALATFPTAFQHGMWREWRARELGDEEANAPKNWQWGVGDEDDPRRADVVILVYAKDPNVLEAKIMDHKLTASNFGHAVTHVVKMTASERKPGELEKEPFGFADGVSQPVIRGAPRRNERALPHDLVEPGEFVLGYPDNIGAFPASPRVADKDDPYGYLPDRCANATRRRPPEFSRYEGTTGERDLGANGTYLVIRQLEQNVPAFTAWLKRAYEQLKTLNVTLETDGNDVAIESKAVAMAHVDKGEAFESLIAAKLVGRWTDGASLVRHPHERPSASKVRHPDNAFKFGREDPRGYGCPFGSHIRRANPRDTRFHETEEESRVEMQGVNRHRLLRVGRAYDSASPKPGELPWGGLLFMCLNADIERQFEFVQKTWLLNRNMHGLENEPDPLLGCGKRSFTIPSPSAPIRLEIDEDFVKMIGGGYFFMPGRSALRYLARGVQPPMHGPLP